MRSLSGAEGAGGAAAHPRGGGAPELAADAGDRAGQAALRVAGGPSRRP